MKLKLDYGLPTRGGRVETTNFAEKVSMQKFRVLGPFMLNCDDLMNVCGLMCLWMNYRMI